MVDLRCGQIEFYFYLFTGGVHSILRKLSVVPNKYLCKLYIGRSHNNNTIYFVLDITNKCIAYKHVLIIINIIHENIYSREDKSIFIYIFLRKY